MPILSMLIVWCRMTAGRCIARSCKFKDNCHTVLQTGTMACY